MLEQAARKNKSYMEHFCFLYNMFWAQCKDIYKDATGKRMKAMSFYESQATLGTRVLLALEKLVTNLNNN
jgi:hypothetical protein